MIEVKRSDNEVKGLGCWLLLILGVLYFCGCSGNWQYCVGKSEYNQNQETRSYSEKQKGKQ